MLTTSSTPALVVHRASWIREQVRDLVCHLPARVETADLLQVALITLAQSVVYFDWAVAGRGPTGQQAFVVHAKARLKVALLDEMRHMSHLGRLQRRRWLLLQLAREHLRAQGTPFEGAPAMAALQALTGLSSPEIETLDRVSQLTGWPAEADIQLYFAQRAEQPCSVQDQIQARLDTQIVMDHVAQLVAEFTPAQREVLGKAFGVHTGAAASPARSAGWWRWLPWSRRPAQRYADRFGTDLDPSEGLKALLGDARWHHRHHEDVWPSGLQALLRPRSPAPGPKAWAPRQTAF